MNDEVITGRHQVLIRELGAREGFQILTQIVPTEQKLELIQALGKTGVQEIEVTSMVRADRVPQLADAESLISQLPDLPGVRWSALYLNQKGFERAEALPQIQNRAWITTATSDTFLQKNANTTAQKIVSELSGWRELFTRHGKELHGVLVSTAFGCLYEGEGVVAQLDGVLERLLESWLAGGGAMPREICLADTVGLAAPSKLRQIVKAISSRYPGTAVSLHLHDTRGTGMANVYAGLEAGVRIFEGSVGGMGGCPFTKGAAGNVASEDLIYLCEREGLSTGINLQRYLEAVRIAERIVGIPLPGKLLRGL
jgi:hydroxymethylglutaryl-CoA lyase